MKFIPLLIGISLGCQSALAADLHVKTDGSDSNSGSSWTDAFQTLQKALSIAVAGDHIWIAEGTYHPDDGPGQTADQRASVFTLTANVEIYGGFPADGSVTNLLDRDPAAHPVILSGEIQQDADPVNNAYHVILADDGNDASNRTILLDGITITGGHADLNDANNNHRGGGILSREALTLRNVIVTGNYALGYGGGASLFVGNCILDQCLFSSNESAGGGGGGAIRLNTSDLTAVDTHFTLNTASNATGDGGAIHCPSNSSLTLTRCEFTANTARYGGGIYKIGSGTLLNCLFSENQAQFGGGIYNGSNLNLTNCAFRANTATSDGGGLFNAPGGTTNLTNCTLRSNQADANGGGFRQNGGTTTLTNTILWDNTEAGTTTAPGAGISVSGTNPFYTYSLIQNQNPTGTGNLDGTDPANDPLFISPTDLRIQLGS
ncbi:MAG: DUF1565 domain-containing protein, partial [Verrucomicrobiales bacterium]|nr:DUF1565 domain-containing protein [Verrucomicrobiales bacterium]